MQGRILRFVEGVLHCEAMQDPFNETPLWGRTPPLGKNPPFGEMDLCPSEVTLNAHRASCPTPDNAMAPGPSEPPHPLSWHLIGKLMNP